MLIGVLIAAPGGLSCDWLETCASQSLGHSRDDVVGALKALPGGGVSQLQGVDSGCFGGGLGGQQGCCVRTWQLQLTDVFSV